MNNLAEIFENDLYELVESKNKQKAHNISLFLFETFAQKQSITMEHHNILKRIDENTALIKQGFEQVDKRLEQVDKRFEEMRIDMNKRFNMMFAFISILFGFITLIISVYHFLGN